MPALADLDHFVGADEMILDPMSTVKTGGPGLLDDLLEIAIVGIAEGDGKVAAGPELVARGVDAADALEGGIMLGRWKGFDGHVWDSFSRLLTETIRHLRARKMVFEIES